MVVRWNVCVRTLICITGKSALAATIAFGLAGCERKAPETVKPAATAPVFSSENLAQRMIERRGVEAVIWGTPAVNFDRIYQAMVHDAKAGEGNNKIVYWSRLSTGRTRPLPPTPTRSTSCRSSTRRTSIQRLRIVFGGSRWRWTQRRPHILV
jgi:hypothetical protein